MDVRQRFPYHAQAYRRQNLPVSSLTLLEAFVQLYCLVLRHATPVKGVVEVGLVLCS